MPTFDQHIRQALSNVEFVKFLAQSPEGFSDWSITGCFYSAVHFAEAVINRESSVACRLANGECIEGRDVGHSSDPKGIDFKSNRPQKSNHWYREQIISLNRDYFGDDFERAYKSLYQLSHQSRYNCYEDCADDLPIAREYLDEIVLQMRDRYQLAI